MSQAETRRFAAEVDQVLHLVTHALYSHKEIFLRELASNASDACDKLRFEAIARPDLLADETVRCIYTWRWVISGCLLTWAVLAAAGIAAFY